MNHLTDDQLSQFVLDAASLLEADKAHAQACPECQRRLETMRRLITELVVACHSQPSPAALDCYFQSFRQLTPAPSPVQTLVQRLRASLQWDSRLQSAQQGVRSMIRKEFRLLYLTPAVSIEMLVTPGATQLEVDGEIIPNNSLAWDAPLLIQLQYAEQLEVVCETESNPDGRFRLATIAPGHYTLLITPPTGVLLEIEGLDLT